MKRIIVAAALILAISSALEAQQLTRYLQQESEFEGVAGAYVRSPDPGEIIIELEAEPLLARASKGQSLAASELDTLLDRLENDIRAIEGEGSDTVSIRGVPAPALVHHRYTLAFAGASATVSPSAVEQIRRLDYVREVHPDRIVTALLHESVEQVGAPRVWSDYGVRGEGVVVAIIDTGIDYTHPALGGGFGATHKVRGGRDFVNDDDDPMDDHGHGTHVAGIVAANGGGLLGVAPEASLLAFKVLDEGGAGRDSWVLAAIEASVQHGADVVNMSLGRPAVVDDPVVKALENAYARGIVFAVAAGNTGRFFGIGSPAGAPSAITVGAIDRDGVVAGFSSKGPVIPGASIKPEIVAPGVGILSSMPGGGSAAFSGTSMAAPHVAGVAALVRSMHPDWSAGRLRNALITAAGPTGAEVMAGGAGAVYAPDAVGTNLYASPSVLSFGISSTGSAVLNRSIFLTNFSSGVVPVSLELEGAREGVELRAAETDFEIKPFETKQIDLALHIDHALVPAPDAGSLSFGGAIRVAGGAGNVSIPWSFTKASRVRVTWTGSGTALVRLGTETMMTEVWVPGNRQAELAIGAGTASLWLQSGAFASTRHIFLEDLDLSEILEVRITPEDAPHRIRFRGNDASGRPLSDRLSLNELVILHPRFSSQLIDAVSLVGAEQDVFLSELSETVKIMGFERAFDVEDSVSWTVPYPPVTGVSGDVDLIVDPDAWVELPIRGTPPRGLLDPDQVISSAIWFAHGNRALTSVARPRIEREGATVTMEARAWLVPSQSSESGGSVIIEIGEWPGGMGPTRPGSAEITAEFTGFDGGLIPGRLPVPRLSDRVIPSGEQVVIGEGPALPILSLGSDDGTLFSTLRWFGPHGEQRSYDARHTHATLTGSDGQQIPFLEPSPSPPGISAGVRLMAELPAPGVYRFEAFSDSFDVAGIPAEATITCTFDSRSDDSAPPMIRSLRFEDGTGRTTAAFSKGSAPAVTFSAIDLTRLGHGGIAKEKTRLEYRSHSPGTGSQTPWTTLTAVEIGDDLENPGLRFPPDGVLYRVDLSGVTSTLSGPVDLRISIEDPSGNATVYAIEPAFVIHGGRRPAVSRR
jgi:subtilisin family serine protease